MGVAAPMLFAGRIRLAALRPVTDVELVRACVGVRLATSRSAPELGECGSSCATSGPPTAAELRKPEIGCGGTRTVPTRCRLSWANVGTAGADRRRGSGADRFEAVANRSDFLPMVLRSSLAGTTWRGGPGPGALRRCAPADAAGGQDAVRGCGRHRALSAATYAVNLVPHEQYVLNFF
jgi:hypothetical protein